ncbi:hypothetical protein FMEAI12_2190003 [Parafrankia sp. Ea1.12]|nr:hypothetical protein FMEAI12_2190003 [Parafrankia sp. Ea1.12]
MDSRQTDSVTIRTPTSPADSRRRNPGGVRLRRRIVPAAAATEAVAPETVETAVAEPDAGAGLPAAGAADGVPTVLMSDDLNSAVAQGKTRALSGARHGRGGFVGGAG